MQFPVDKGDEQLFADSDGLYMDGRTLYIMQNFSQKITVVDLTDDLTQGTFVKNLVSEAFRSRLRSQDLAVASTPLMRTSWSSSPRTQIRHQFSPRW